MNKTDFQKSFFPLAKDYFDLPTAPFYEALKIDFVKRFLAKSRVPFCEDSAGNLFAPCSSISQIKKRNLILGAHLDHPGFEILSFSIEKKLLLAKWLGGPPKKGMENAFMDVFSMSGERLFKTKIAQWSPKQSDLSTFSKTLLKKPGRSFLLKLPQASDSEALKKLIKEGVFGSPSLKSFSGGTSKKWVEARHIDDGIHVVLLLMALKDLKSKNKAIFMFSRGEEVGFAGILQAIYNQQFNAKKQSFIALEASAELPLAECGKGSVIRLGDRSSIYHGSLLQWMREIARNISSDTKIPYQSRIMDGGSCEASGFNAFGFAVAGVSIPLKNYHNSGAKKVENEKVSKDDVYGAYRLICDIASHADGFHLRKPQGIDKKTLNKIRKKYSKKLQK